MKSNFIDFKLTKLNLVLILWCAVNFILTIAYGNYLVYDKEFNEFIDDLKEVWFISDISYYDWSELLLYTTLGFIIYGVVDNDKINAAKTIKSIVLYSLVCIGIIYILNIFRREVIEKKDNYIYYYYYFWGTSIDEELYKLIGIIQIVVVFTVYPVYKGIKWIVEYSKN